MSNLLQNGIYPNIASKHPLSFNTLELLDHDQCLMGFQPIEKSRKILLKKAKNTYFSKQLAKNLIALDSKLKKGYKRTYYDCCSLLIQEKDKITSRYCKARWCNVCNRIRTAQLLNGYLKPLEQLINPYFVTLTIPNVNKADLKHSIKEMVSTSTNIIRSLKRKGIAFNGIRKVECTYNVLLDNYHPHFHFIVEGKEVAKSLVNEWLNRNQTSNILGQDYRATDKNGVKELFKYTTKIVTKTTLTDFNIYLSPLDTIFTAIKGMRTFQSFGNIKKVSEDIEELNSELYKDIEEYDFIVWKWEKNDWQNMVNGNMLTNYKPSKEMIELTTTKIVI